MCVCSFLTNQSCRQVGMQQPVKQSLLCSAWEKGNTSWLESVLNVRLCRIVLLTELYLLIITFGDSDHHHIKIQFKFAALANSCFKL